MSETPEETAPDGAGSAAQSPYQAHLAAQASQDGGDETRGAALLDWRTRWDSLSSSGKLRAKQLGVATAIGVLGYGLYSASTADKPVVTAPEASKLDMGAGLRGDSLEVKLRGDLKKVLDGQSMLGDRVTAIEEGKTPVGPQGTAPGATGVDGAPLPPALPGGGAPEFPPAPSGAAAAAGDGSLPPPPSAPVAPPAPPIEKMVGAIGGATTPIVPKDAAASSEESKKKIRTIYLPPGFMKARLLTGVDALASHDATSNPEPIIARVQAPAVLPNDVKANLSGCFVIGNATGSLAKERVEIQLVTLSCVDFDEHSVVDQSVKGFFVDTDGKKGLSG